MVEDNFQILVEELCVWFGEILALKAINLKIIKHEILSIIGPARSGKTTFLRMLNRLNDEELNFKFSGSVSLDGLSIYKLSPQVLRRRVGMVFALPVVLPLSVFENIAYGPRMQGINDKKRLELIVQKALRDAYLWDEAKDRLKESAFKLSGGQQQRLCIARTLALGPEVILFDEPCSGLDPISTAKIEEAMQKLKEDYTIILVTNNVKQAARISDGVAFFLSGELIELDRTDKLFTAPGDKRTEDYIMGRFG